MVSDDLGKTGDSHLPTLLSEVIYQGTIISTRLSRRIFAVIEHKVYKMQSFTTTSSEST